MHGLDVLIARNAEAAGREAAHAVVDDDPARCRAIGEADVAIYRAASPLLRALLARAYSRGLILGLQEV